MSLTSRGRYREMQALARRFLEELGTTTQAFASQDDNRWYSDYALGFAAGHVGLAIQLAQKRYALAWIGHWPSDADRPRLVHDLVPRYLRLDRERFVAAYERASDAHKHADGYHPMNLGAGDGHTALLISLARTLADVRRDYFGLRMMKLEVELRKIPAPTQFGRLTGYRPAALIYGYLVRRTLGEAVFGVTAEQATHFALTYQPPGHSSADAKPS